MLEKLTISVTQGMEYPVKILIHSASFDVFII